VTDRQTDRQNTTRQHRPRYAASLGCSCATKKSRRSVIFAALL